MIEQQFLAQHGIDRFGHGRPLTRTQSAVIAEKTGDYGVSRVIKLEG
jgi:hypothetical protein